MTDLREALEKLIQDWRDEADSDERYLPRSHASEIHDVEASIRLLRMHANMVEEVLAAHPDKLSPGAFFATEPAEWYGEYGVRYTSGPRKGSMPRRFRELAEAVEFVAAGSDEMVVLHRVVGKWAEVEL